MTNNELDGPVRRLCRQFPGVPHDAIASILGDSYRLVVEATGTPEVTAAERLARLRLEVRTRHPALG